MRKVICASETAVYAYMKKSNPGDEPTFPQMHDFFKEFSDVDAEAFVADGHTIFTTTVPDGSLLYMPPGFVVAEVVHGGDLAYGFKKPLVCKGHKDTLKKIQTHLETLGKGKDTAETLKTIVGAL